MVMEGMLTKELERITNGKLNDEEIKSLCSFIEKISGDGDKRKEDFFKRLSYEMTMEIKGLASLILNFRKELEAKLEPEINAIATHCIPKATDQLQAIIEATEIAAQKIMDNLESMQDSLDKLQSQIEEIRNIRIGEDGSRGEKIKRFIDFINNLEQDIERYNKWVSDSFIQMSFQDLTGQRIKKIIELVNEMEKRIQKIVISVGIRLSEKEKNPDLSSDEIEKMVEKKIELAGPQKPGEGLSQEDIDALLANL